MKLQTVLGILLLCLIGGQLAFADLTREDRKFIRLQTKHARVELYNRFRQMKKAMAAAEGTFDSNLLHSQLEVEKSALKYQFYHSIFDQLYAHFDSHSLPSGAHEIPVLPSEDAPPPSDELVGELIIELYRGLPENAGDVIILNEVLGRHVTMAEVSPLLFQFIVKLQTDPTFYAHPDEEEWHPRSDRIFRESNAFAIQNTTEQITETYLTAFIGPTSLEEQTSRKKLNSLEEKMSRARRQANHARFPDNPLPKSESLAYAVAITPGGAEFLVQNAAKLNLKNGGFLSVLEQIRGEQARYRQQLIEAYRKAPMKEDLDDQELAIERAADALENYQKHVDALKNTFLGACGSAANP